MIHVHYGVVRVNGGWRVISDGLQLGDFADREEAEALARRLAEAAPVGVPVHLHLQAPDGELRREDLCRA
jgi:hypothetical protein